MAVTSFSGAHIAAVFMILCVYLSYDTYTEFCAEIPCLDNTSYL